jgi:sec-independent protein translocase protein TatA
MPSLPGGGELIIILLIAILLFGAKKLPDLGRSMGQSITNFKRGINEGKEADEIPPDTADVDTTPQSTSESRQP